MSVDSSTQDDAGASDDAAASDATTSDANISDTGSADGGPSNERTVSTVIGSTGGSLVLDTPAGSVSLTIPAGALASDVEIAIDETGDGVPNGYDAYSALYRFRPEGTQFARPVRIALPFRGDARLATLFWSRSGATGYERIGGLPMSTVVTASVTHFSSAFIANGVDYTDPPDRTCVDVRALQSRIVEPSGLAMFFQVDDCQGRPIRDLTGSDFQISEDGAVASSETGTVAIPTRGVQVFVKLVLDVSNSTRSSRTALIAGARAFVISLQVTRALPVQIGIDLFAGSSIQWLAPTLDSALLLSRLDQVAAYVPTDPNSTDLYGAIENSLATLDRAEHDFEVRNRGGAIASGYLVLFSDGHDSARRRTLPQVLATIAADRSNQILAVSLDSSPDYAPAVLAQLAGNGVIASPDPATLDRDFSNLAARIAGQVNRSYLVGYCTSSRAGSHTVSVAVANTINRSTASFRLNADGFGPSCSGQQFTSACSGTPGECGGLACGACDDRTAACDQTANLCRDFCDAQASCGGATISTPTGYRLVCNDARERTACRGSCVNLDYDAFNCNGCGILCPNQGAVRLCLSGACTHYQGLGQASAVKTGPNHDCAFSSNSQGAGVQCFDKTTGQRTTSVAVLGPAFDIDATDLYFFQLVGNTNVLHLVRAPQAGGPATDASNVDLRTLFGMNVPSSLVLGTGVAYVGTRRVSLSGNAVSPAPFAMDLASIDTIVSDATNVYWASTDGFIKAAPHAGGPTVNVATPTSEVLLLKVLGPDLYWLTVDGVYRAPIGNGGPVRIERRGECSTPQYRPCGRFAVDAQFITWQGTVGFETGIFRTPTTGGPAQLLIPSSVVDSVRGVGLLEGDGVTLYFNSVVGAYRLHF